MAAPSKADLHTPTHPVRFVTASALFGGSCRAKGPR